MAPVLTECFELQLKESGLLTHKMSNLLTNIDLLTKHDRTRLARCCHVDEAELNQMIDVLKSLSPKPGLQFYSEPISIITPDVFVRDTSSGSFSVELNTETLPKVLIDRKYFTDVCGLNSDDDVSSFITDCQQNAGWLVKSLDQRAKTILKLTKAIVKQQEAFFRFRVAHLRHLNLKDIAEEIEMHESTVSRVTSNKYVSTPRGTYYLKYFFTSCVSSSDGGAHSAEVVGHKIKVMIDEEKSCERVNQMTK